MHESSSGKKSSTWIISVSPVNSPFPPEAGVNGAAQHLLIRYPDIQDMLRASVISGIN